MKFLLDLFKNLNGYKYILGVGLAVLSSWYDLRSDLRDLRLIGDSRASAVEQYKNYQMERDAEQSRQIIALTLDVKEELRLLRQELNGRRK